MSEHEFHDRFVEAIGDVVIWTTTCGLGYQVRSPGNSTIGFAPDAVFLGDRRMHSKQDNLRNARLFARALSAEYSSVGQGMGRQEPETKSP